MYSSPNKASWFHTFFTNMSTHICHQTHNTSTLLNTVSHTMSQQQIFILPNIPQFITFTVFLPFFSYCTFHHCPLSKSWTSQTWFLPCGSAMWSSTDLSSRYQVVPRRIFWRGLGWTISPTDPSEQPGNSTVWMGRSSAADVPPVGSSLNSGHLDSSLDTQEWWG